jgi:hypothetical protein
MLAQEEITGYFAFLRVADDHRPDVGIARHHGSAAAFTCCTLPVTLSLSIGGLQVPDAALAAAQIGGGRAVVK